MKKFIKSGLELAGLQVRRMPADDTALRYAGYSRESLKTKSFLNIGAGNFTHRYWTNVDYSTQWYGGAQQTPFVNWNAMDLGPLPFSSSESELIYTCHMVEHITDDAASNLFGEAHRILKTGGLIRIITPCADTAYRAYLRRDRAFFGGVANPFADEISLERAFVGLFASEVCIQRPDRPHRVEQATDEQIVDVFSRMKMEQGLDHFTHQCRYDDKFPGSHINWWSERKLAAALQIAGFSNVYRSGHGQSAALPLRDLNCFDPGHYSSYSLYMEGIK